MVKLSLILISFFGIFSGLILLLLIKFQFQTKIFEANNYYKHRLILIVLDAFRHDYLEIAKSRNINLSNLKFMSETGARVMKMTAAFPTVTMPNHQTLITGLFTPYHGIIYNTFNDSSFQYEQFSMNNQKSLNEDKWYQGFPDPIWVTCEKHGHCKSGSMLWPNTDAFISGVRPHRKVDQYIALNEGQSIYPYDRRVDEMLDWIKNDLIDFGLLYFDEPDVTSHKFGPTHINTLKVINEMDNWIGRLFSGIRNADLSNKIDIILTADHGMTGLDSKRVINIDDFVDPKLYKSTYSYPVGFIYPNPGEEERVYKLYKNASKYIDVFWRKDIPDKYYYKDNVNRISPIVTIVKLGWVVNSSHNIAQMKGGNHGYSQYEDDMKASFLACGPSFKHKNIETANHVDLYPLMMHLLGLQANPNNGSLKNLLPLLTESAQLFKSRDDMWKYDKFVVMVYFIFISPTVFCMIYIICILFNCLNKRQIFNRNRKDSNIRYNEEQSEVLINGS